MNKFYGVIGFAVNVEAAPGVWLPQEAVTPRYYYGDIIRNNRRFQTADQVNDNLTITNEISIVSDLFANENFQSMRYVEFMGAKWKITNVEVQYPRLILTLGGIYNG